MKTQEDINSAVNEAFGAFPASGEECLTLDTLARLADDTLSRPEAQVARAHFLRCPACAAQAGQTARLFQPIRQIHTGWNGWKTAWLDAKGRAFPDEPMTRRLWESHKERCRACARRTRIVSRLFAPEVSRPAPIRRISSHALSFGLGACLASVSVFAFWTPRSAPITRSGSPPPAVQTAPPDDIQILQPVSKGLGGLETQTPLRQLLHPTLQQLPAAMRQWEQAAQADPEDRAVLEKLAQLYGQAAQNAKDSTQRAYLLSQQQKMRARLSTRP